jgi:hypothetical protein
MIDYSEIEHGHELLVRYFRPNGDASKFIATFDSIAAECCREAFDIFNKRWDGIRLSTYITCFSEHLKHEDTHRRLSLWRAFGNTESSVAIVLRNLPKQNVPAIGVFFSPVLYFSYEDLKAEFAKIAEDASKNIHLLKTLSRPYLVQWILLTLITAALSLKHSAFAEELEWRLIYLPEFHKSPIVSQSVETVRGVPQVVHKVHMQNKPEMNITGIEIDEVLDRLIIGPTQFSLSIYDAVMEELKAAGVSAPQSRIVVSGIPLRT